MKTITQYKSDIKHLMHQIANYDAQAIAESRDLTEGEILLKNEMLDAVEEINRMVATLERQERVQSFLESPDRKTVADTQTGNKTSSGSTYQVGIDNRSKEKFNSFGEQMAAVMTAGIGRGVDPRLYNAMGANETVPSEGGFLVQTDFSTEIMQQVFETSIIASRVRRIPISGSSNSTTMNGVDETSRATGSRYGGIRGYWADEAEEKTASKPKFRRIELNLKKLIGLCYATDENLEDAAQLEGIIRQGFVSEFGFLLDDAIINGTGAGQPLGIMNAGCLVSVAKQVGQAANTLVFENIVDMYSRLFAGSRQNAVWLINQNVEPQLFAMSMAVGTGGVPVYMPAGGISGQPYSTLFGRPVLPIEQCQALGDKGDIILGDFPNGYILAEKGGMKSDMSIHVRFIFDESTFRFVMRVDGQPVRSSALTPFKGGATATQSHFITLDARA
jgi:HK97 family phage major capsid protein